MNQSNELPPCTFGVPLMDYFDRADVRESLHISNLVGEWELCTNGIDYTSFSTGS
jgi:hypothetical protein